jgi:sulfide:quinone oxidoreductase
MPEVVCIGDMGGGKAFYIHSTSWFGGDEQTLKMGRVPYNFKQAYQKMFFERDGHIPNWGLPVAEWVAETINI